LVGFSVLWAGAVFRRKCGVDSVCEAQNLYFYMKKVIAFDFDGVLMNFNAGFTSFHNQVHGTNIEYKDIFLIA